MLFTQQDDNQSRTPFIQTDNQLFTSVKDNYSDHFLFDPPVFSHMGEDDEAEMDDRKMTFYCPLSVWVERQLIQLKRERVYEYCLSVF